MATLGALALLALVACTCSAKSNPRDETSIESDIYAKKQLDSANVLNLFQNGLAPSAISDLKKKAATTSNLTTKKRSSLLCRILQRMDFTSLSFPSKGGVGPCILKIPLNGLFEAGPTQTHGNVENNSRTTYNLNQRENTTVSKTILHTNSSNLQVIGSARSSVRPYLLKSIHATRSTQLPRILSSSNVRLTTKVPRKTSTTRRPYPMESTTRRPHPWESTTKRPHPWESTTKRPHPWESTTKRPDPRESTTKRPHTWESTTKRPHPSESTTKRPYPWESTTRTPYPWESTTRRPYPWESTTRRPYPWESTTKRPYPWESTTKRPYPWESTTRRPYPWESTTRRPYPWESTTKRPYPWESTTRRPYPWESTTRRPYPWESTTRRPYPWESTTRRPYPWESTTRRPFTWEVRSDPWEWKTTRRPDPWEWERTTEWFDRWEPPTFPSIEPWEPPTFPPFIIRRRSSSFQPVYFVVIAGVFVGGSALAVLLRVCALRCGAASRRASEEVLLHFPPPHGAAPVPAAASPVHVQLGDPASGIDKPPDYFAVIRRDGLVNRGYAGGGNEAYLPVAVHGGVAPPPYAAAVAPGP